MVALFNIVLGLALGTAIFHVFISYVESAERCAVCLVKNDRRAVRRDGDDNRA